MIRLAWTSGQNCSRYGSIPGKGDFITSSGTSASGQAARFILRRDSAVFLYAYSSLTCLDREPRQPHQRTNLLACSHAEQHNDCAGETGNEYCSAGTRI